MSIDAVQRSALARLGGDVITPICIIEHFFVMTKRPLAVRTLACPEIPNWRQAYPACRGAPSDGWPGWRRLKAICQRRPETLPVPMRRVRQPQFLLKMLESGCGAVPKSFVNLQNGKAPIVSGEVGPPWLQLLLAVVVERPVDVGRRRSRLLPSQRPPVRPCCDAVPLRSGLWPQ